MANGQQADTPSANTTVIKSSGTGLDVPNRRCCIRRYGAATGEKIA